VRKQRTEPARTCSKGGKREPDMRGQDSCRDERSGQRRANGKRSARTKRARKIEPTTLHNLDGTRVRLSAV